VFDAGDDIFWRLSGRPGISFSHADLPSIQNMQSRGAVRD
jgi:hypothetical protein